MCAIPSRDDVYVLIMFRYVKGDYRDLRKRAWASRLALAAAH
jgi:hypothetical protein